MGKAKEQLALAREKLGVIDEQTVELRNRIRKDLEIYSAAESDADRVLASARAGVEALEGALASARSGVSLAQAKYVRLNAENNCRRQMLREIEGLEEGIVPIPF